MSVIARIVKSRPRRERRIGTSNATRVRDATTHKTSEATTAIAISTADATLFTSPTKAPLNASSVASGATPTSDAASTPLTSWRRLSGSVASRCGSRVSSLPKPRMGKIVQPSVAVPKTTIARSGPVESPRVDRQRQESDEGEHAGADRAQDEEHGALADAQSVAEEPELQSDECSNHDNPCRSAGSPTRATNASSSVPPARSTSSGPAHAMRPLTITAT